MLIIYPHGNLTSNPTMVALIRELVQRGIQTDLWSGGDIGKIENEIANESFFRASPLCPSIWDECDKPILIRRVINSIRKKGREYELASAIKAVSHFDLIIGVDPVGIVMAANINQSKRPLAYISFELLFEREAVSPYEVELKRRETAAITECSLALLQDTKRCELFCEENTFESSSVVLVPVAPLDANPIKTDYLRELLNIHQDRRIVLYQGSLYDWSCRHEFEELVSYWDDRYCLVIHSRDAPDKRMKRFLSSLSASGRIHCTHHPVSADDLPTLTASADVGLACYRTSPDHWITGDNLKYLGFSSGKIAYYAMCGLPILSRKLENTSEVLNQEGLGASYNRLSESGFALDHIFENLETMSRNARNFYRTHLSPCMKMNTFVERLLRL